MAALEQSDREVLEAVARGDGDAIYENADHPLHLIAHALRFEERLIGRSSDGLYLTAAGEAKLAGHAALPLDPAQAKWLDGIVDEAAREGCSWGVSGDMVVFVARGEDSVRFHDAIGAVWRLGSGK